MKINLRNFPPDGRHYEGEDPVTILDVADPGVRFDRRIDFIFHHGKGLVPLCSNVVDVTTGLRPSPRSAAPPCRTPWAGDGRRAAGSPP